MIVILKEYELMMAASVAVRRQVTSLVKGYKNKYGAKEEEAWQIAVEGACGECAFARAMNWYWDGSENTFKRPDVGNIQVRTRCVNPRKRYNFDHELYIRPGEVGTFALVTGIAPRYEVHGWFNALEVRDEWLRKHGGRPEAYFIPNKFLHPLETLKSVVQNPF